uniref:SH2 domain-containing protein n=1 Tax=Trichobilharzia regenti TaxID=157069 RepID=A0AA85JXD1_TRIRE|nr:unnamed protein product [Trichobilharzia regenti]
MTFNLPLMKDEIIYRYSSYIGSFPVEEQDNACRAQKVQKELEALRSYTRSKSVIVCVSIRGIKICSDDLKVVYMAHALRRISYATCDATHKQVAFLAREPSGIVNLQYCHVFVTGTSGDAEELNRIIGDAFKLAYLRQRLIKLHQSGKHDASTMLNIPQLSDCYPVWLPQIDETTKSLSLLNTLKLPPPPSFPPPPPPPLTTSTPIENEMKMHEKRNSPTASSSSSELRTCSMPHSATDSNPIITCHHASVDSSCVNNISKMTDEVKIDEQQQQQPVWISSGENPTTSSSSSENDSNQLSVHSDSVLVGRDEKADTSAASITTVMNDNNIQSNKEASELEKKLHRISSPQAIDLAFLRRHFLRRSEGKGSESAKNVRGGSARQPRLRQGTTLSSLLSSARHSAFFPSSTSCVIDSGNVIPETSKSQETPDVSDVLNNLNPTRRPPIFVDLRTFAGGSPVVALKERLDAQAIADAKASAFAEAAAVLAAAKQVSSQSVSTSQSSVSNFPVKVPPPTKSMIYPVVSRASNPSFNENVSSVENSDISPPIPPVRTPQPNMYKPVQQTFAPSDFTGGIQYSSENSYLHGETAAQSQSQYPFKNLTRYTKNDIHQANCHVYRPNENFTSSPFNDPLHVIADSGIHSFQEPHKKQTFPSSRCDNLQTTPTPGSIMSTSSLSTETPTPTATPTPTPEQPSQSPHGCFTTIDNGDNYSLSQAPWYQALLPREIAFELLAREEIGSFLVRNSATHPGCCALSVRVSNKDNPIGITHYLIQRTNRGVRLKGLDKEWPSLQALVTHLTVIPEMLPCPLKLPQYTTNPVFTQFDPHLTTANCASNEVTKQRRNYNARSSRTEMSVNNTDVCSHHHHSQRTLHSVADLPCRPVPPACATISHLGGSTTTTTTTIPTTNPHDQNSFSSSQDRTALSGCYQVSKCSQVNKSSQVPNWLLSQMKSEDNNKSRPLSAKSSTNSPNQKTPKLECIQGWKQNSVDLATIISQSDYDIEDRSLCDNVSNNKHSRKLSYTKMIYHRTIIIITTLFRLCRRR